LVVELDLIIISPEIELCKSLPPFKFFNILVQIVNLSLLLSETVEMVCNCSISVLELIVSELHLLDVTNVAYMIVEVSLESVLLQLVMSRIFHFDHLFEFVDIHFHVGVFVHFPLCLILSFDV